MAAPDGVEKHASDRGKPAVTAPDGRFGANLLD